jgi:acyl carrier protein
MPPIPPPDLAQIQKKVCEIIAGQLGLKVDQINIKMRLVQDLNCDSLDIVEIIMSLEDAFDVSFPDHSASSPAYDGYIAAVFTRNPFRVRDLAELVYIEQTRRRPAGANHSKEKPASDSHAERHSFSPELVPFTQLSGTTPGTQDQINERYDDAGINSAGVRCLRRKRDGMRCMVMPSANVLLGYEGSDAEPQEQPLHNAWIDAFIIDAEPVSTTAYARFLNSIGPVSDKTLREWFVLDESDGRVAHQMLKRGPKGWSAVPGTETFPMVLVSWYGAHAYARWANQANWRDYRYAEATGYLPSEAQWEYAARGVSTTRYPWGNAEPKPHLLNVAVHQRGQTYPAAADLPLSPVNARLGMTGTGLHHMAGNVWQWCADWYAPDFYKSPQASLNNPENKAASCVRSERGGSWVGPASLARSSYRRARTPEARGRCLGFRCVSNAIPALRGLPA